VLEPGVHLNVVGSNSAPEAGKWMMPSSSGRTCLVVDARDHVRLEGGDLLGALERGRLFPEAMRELGEVVAGRTRDARAVEAITALQSHGLALENVAVGAYVYREARAQGVGWSCRFSKCAEPALTYSGSALSRSRSRSLVVVVVVVLGAKGVDYDYDYDYDYEPNPNTSTPLRRS